MSFRWSIRRDAPPFGVGADPATQGVRGLPHTPPKTQNSKPEFSGANRNCCRASPPVSVSPQKGETDKGIAARTKDGGIAQLVERRLCKPNVAGSSPTASTSSSTKNPQVGGVARPGRVAQLVRARP